MRGPLEAWVTFASSEGASRLLLIGLNALIQTTVILAVAMAAAHLLRKRGPVFLTALYRGALAACVASLVFTVITSSMPRGAHPTAWTVSPPPTLFQRNLIADLIASTSGTTSAGSHSTAAVPAAATNSPATGASTLLITWALISAALLAYLAGCHFVISRLVRSAKPAPVPLWEMAAQASQSSGEPMPRLLCSPNIRSPFLTGILRPAILLPPTVESEFGPAELRAILMHELTHLARRECFWNLTGRVLAAVLWPQALLWVLLRRMEECAEQACDAVVLDQACPPTEYARCLVGLAERRLPSLSERAAGAGVVGFRSSLGRRVQQIMSTNRPSIRPLSGRVRGSILAGGVGVALCATLLVSVKAANRQPQAAPGPKADLRSLAGAAVGAAPQETSADTPKGAVEAFVAALNKANVRAACALVQGSKPDGVPADLVEHMKSSNVVITVSDLVAETSGDTAKVALKWRFTEKASGPNGGGSGTDMVELKKTANGWMIVPGKINELNGRMDALVSTLSGMLANPAVMKHAHAEAASVACLSNIKQVSLGAIMYASDRKDRFALKATGYKAAIMPYLKNEQVFHCASDKSGHVSYSFNEKLQNVTMKNMRATSETVMIYEGSNGKLDFRHDGKAAVGFADGHAKLVSSEEARKLRWDP